MQVSAANQEEAVEKLMLLMRSHQTQAHPEAVVIPDNTIRAIVMTYIVKE